MKKKIKIMLGLMLIASCISACGTKSQETESKEVEVNFEKIEDDTNSSFGLKDFEGFYYQTNTEEIDGYSVTCTYGYQFNGDGTGTYYGQDNIDMTWNETEIHCGDQVYNYDMEPGMLTVHINQNSDEVYEKCKGKFIKPNPYNIDVENVEDGIYPANFNADDITEKDGNYTIKFSLYTEDTYDIVDIGQMTTGDIIFIGGSLIEVKTVDRSDAGYIEVNGGIEEGGTNLRSLEESNCYVFFGFDDISTYTNKGVVELAFSEAFKLIDESDPSDSKEYTGSEAVERLKELADNYLISQYSCRILVENGMVSEITNLFTP